MIAHIQGQILKITNKGIILSTGNIGYFVHLSKTLLNTLNENDQIALFTHHQIKEDLSELYGFNEYEDLIFFHQLISINGVGPKVATEIMGVPSNEVKSAIINEDENFICTIPGIGKKTAKRLILELKEQIILNEDLSPLQQNRQRTANKVSDDAMHGLIQLGYQKHEITQKFKDLPKELITAEEIITFVLKNH